jgi:hypothetical protein
MVRFSDIKPEEINDIEIGKKTFSIPQEMIDIIRKNKAHLMPNIK